MGGRLLIEEVERGEADPLIQVGHWAKSSSPVNGRHLDANAVWITNGEVVVRRALHIDAAFTDVLSRSASNASTPAQK